MTIDTKILDGNKIVETKALIDCGAQGAFIDERFTKEHQLPLLRLKRRYPSQMLTRPQIEMDLSGTTPDSQ